MQNTERFSKSSIRELMDLVNCHPEVGLLDVFDAFKNNVESGMSVETSISMVKQALESCSLSMD